MVANVQLLLSPFLSSLSCKLVKDQENQYSYFGVSYKLTCQIMCANLSLSKVRQVFSAKTLSQGEECQVCPYANSIGIPLEQNTICHVYYAPTVHIQLSSLFVLFHYCSGLLCQNGTANQLGRKYFLNFFHIASYHISGEFDAFS